MSIYNLLGGFLEDHMFKDRCDPEITHDLDIYNTINGKKQIREPAFNNDKELSMGYYQKLISNFFGEECTRLRPLIDILIEDLDNLGPQYKEFNSKDSFQPYLTKKLLSRFDKINPIKYAQIIDFINQVNIKTLEGFNSEKVEYEKNKRELKSTTTKSGSSEIGSSETGSATNVKEQQFKIKKKDVPSDVTLTLDNIKEWLFTLSIPKAQVSVLATPQSLFLYGIEQNPSKFLKINDTDIKSLDKDFNKLAEPLGNYMKNIKSNIGHFILKNNEKYNDQFFKIFPLYFTNQNLFTKILNYANFVIYIILDDKYYEILSNISEPNNTEIKYITINSNYVLEKLQNKPDGRNIIKKDDNICITNIKIHPHYKNILITKADLNNIENSLYASYVYFRQFENTNNSNNKIFKFMDYLYNDLNGHLIAKKPLIGNIFNLFILSGNFNLTYKLFGSNNNSELLPITVRSGGDIKLTPSNFGFKPGNETEIEALKKTQNLSDISPELIKKINDHIEKSDIAKVLIGKFKEYIGPNYKNYLNKDISGLVLVTDLGSITFENIPLESQQLINTVKKNLLELIVSTDKIITPHSEGLNLIDSYNYYDAIDVTHLLQNKLEDLRKLSYIYLDKDTETKISTLNSEIKATILKINNIISRPRDLTKFYLIFDIVYVRKLSLDIKSNLNNHDLVNHLIDIFVCLRLQTSVNNIPFNPNIIYHDSRNQIISLDALRKDDKYKDITEMYLNNKIIYTPVKYGGFARVNNTGTSKRSDCGETLILNLFNYLIWDNETSTLDVTKLPANIKSSIKTFYEQHNKLSSMYDQAVREQFDETLYDEEFVLQTRDFYGRDPGDHYRVYTQDPSDLPREARTNMSKTEALAKVIYDQDGNLLPDAEEIKYSGYVVRPGYWNIIKLLNKITGFNQVSDKYNDNNFLRNINENSLKEILQATFTNYDPEDYKVIEYNNNMDSYAKIKIQINAYFDLEMYYYHAYVNYNGKSSDRADDNVVKKKKEISPWRKFYLLGNTPSLRYYQSFVGKLLPDKDIDKIDILEILMKESEKAKQYLKEIIQRNDQKKYNNVTIKKEHYEIYKLLMAPDEMLPLYNLPNDSITSSIKYEDNILFQVLHDKIIFTNQTIDDYANINNYSTIEYLISFYKGVNNRINSRGDTILTMLMKYGKKSLLEELYKNNNDLDLNIKNIYGNNILHYQQFTDGELSIQKNIEFIKSVLTPVDYDKLIKKKNHKGEYPFISVLFKNDRSIFLDTLLPINDTIKADIIYTLFFNKNNKSKKYIREILAKFTNLDFRNKLMCLLIKILLNQGYFNFETVFDLNYLPADEIKFLNYLILNNRISPLKLQIQSDIEIFKAIFDSKFIIKYDINPWSYISLYSRSDNLTLILDIFKQSNKQDLIPLLGLTNDQTLLNDVINWSIKNFKEEVGTTYLPVDKQSTGLRELLDMNGNTIYHNIAIASRLAVNNTSNIKKLFGFLLKPNNNYIYEVKNNSGWRLIDILSWFVKIDLIDSNYDHIKDMIELVYKYFEQFNNVGNSSNYKPINIEDYIIILTRHYLNIWYGYIDKCIELMSYLDEWLILYHHKVNAKLLNELGKSLNLHEYDYKNVTLKKFNYDKNNSDLFNNESYLEEVPAIEILRTELALELSKQSQRRMRLTTESIITENVKNKYPILKKGSFKFSKYVSNDRPSIKYPLDDTDKQINKLKFPNDQYEIYRKKVSELINQEKLKETNQGTDPVTDPVTDPATNSATNQDPSSKQKYYLLYKKYKTKYLTLKTNLSK